MPPNTLSLSTTALDCTFSRADSRLALDRFGLPGSSAVLASADLFAITLNDAHLTAGDFTLLDATTDTPTPDVQRLTATLAGHGLDITLYVHTYADTGLVEIWQALRSTASTPQTIASTRSRSTCRPAAGSTTTPASGEPSSSRRKRRSKAPSSSKRGSAARPRAYIRGSR